MILDVRCGANNDQVSICQKVKGKDVTSCVPVAQVSSSLNGGATLGSCGSSPLVITRTDVPVIPTPKVIGGVDNYSKLGILAEAFKVTVAPNPTTTDFRMKVETSSNTPIGIRLFDATGRVLATITGVQNNQTVTFGGNYIAGSYFAEVIQGNNHKTVKLIKL
jgi:hypothetical protein